MLPLVRTEPSRRFRQCQRSSLPGPGSATTHRDDHRVGCRMATARSWTPKRIHRSAAPILLRRPPASTLATTASTAADGSAATASKCRVKMATPANVARQQNRYSCRSLPMVASCGSFATELSNRVHQAPGKRSASAAESAAGPVRSTLSRSDSAGVNGQRTWPAPAGVARSPRPAVWRSAAGTSAADNAANRLAGRRRVADVSAGCQLGSFKPLVRYLQCRSGERLHLLRSTAHRAAIL